LESCKQCGTCCRKGGPALHHEDSDLLKKRIIPLSVLITIRQGEPVFSPLSDKIEPAKFEILKIGSENSWTCPFFLEESNHCSIYQNRPIECCLLQCWNTSQIAKVIYKNNLDRWDIIGSQRPIYETLKSHELDCDYRRLDALAKQRKDVDSDSVKEQMDKIFAQDMAIREKAIKEFNLSLSQELFYFGRPMFKSLQYWNEAPQAKANL
jgi:Fe-S-cluster containining protein